jgi:hypothetical protein
MLLTNHALTGVYLGTLITEPLLAFPAGVVSHLLLDMTPHGSWVPGPFVHPRPRKDDPIMSFFNSPKNFILGSLDFAGALIMLGAGLFAFPERRVSIAAGWLGAVAPDLLYLSEIFFKKRLLPKFKAIHHRIQWSESGYGIVTEAIWAVVILHLLYHI